MGRLAPTGSLIPLVLALVLAGCISPPSDNAPPPVAPAETASLLLVNETFNGTLLCGVGTPEGSLNPCIGRNVFTFDISPGLQTLLVAITWGPVTPLAETLYLAIETRGYGAITNPPDAHRYWAANVHPGHLVRIDNGTMDPEDHDWDAIKTNTTLQLRVFAGRTLPPSVTIDQDFTLHVVAAYGERAPEGLVHLVDRSSPSASGPQLS